jgi:hypothetical protein
MGQGESQDFGVAQGPGGEIQALPELPDGGQVRGLVHRPAKTRMILGAFDAAQLVGAGVLAVDAVGDVLSGLGAGGFPGGSRASRVKASQSKPRG